MKIIYLLIFSLLILNVTISVNKQCQYCWNKFSSKQYINICYDNFLKEYELCLTNKWLKFLKTCLKNYKFSDLNNKNGDKFFRPRHYGFNDTKFYDSFTKNNESIPKKLFSLDHRKKKAIDFIRNVDYCSKYFIDSL